MHGPHEHSVPEGHKPKVEGGEHVWIKRIGHRRFLPPRR
ncbi:hypothetical protein roselon_01152 [Roseibacterium elongatum DSM 19469]|uniref:Uncharacterized protein n=1 Tax=Roseicyclus elongatus DSM 19469 TaxID=1294273 RepID=W8RR39_9RHOB|nr:hypothetical protein roselon_01152 [Roseibacterium elongatum DSM 19469]